MPLDAFYKTVLQPKFFPSGCSELSNIVFHRILILSQGNATIESGFSVNESLLVENLKETSLVNQRIVADSVKLCGRPVNVPVTKQMLDMLGRGIGNP